MAPKCAHPKPFSLYKRKPRSDGGGFEPHGKRCPECGSYLPPA